MPSVELRRYDTKLVWTPKPVTRIEPGTISGIKAVQGPEN